MANGRLIEGINQAGSKSEAKLYVASEAVGDFDLMRAMRSDGLGNARTHTTENPHSLNEAPYLDGKELPEHQEQLVSRGSSREAIAGFPKNVNVTISVTLTAFRVDETGVKINSYPGLEINIHDIRFNGDSGTAGIKVTVKPSGKNARSSTLAV